MIKYREEEYSGYYGMTGTKQFVRTKNKKKLEIKLRKAEKTLEKIKSISKNKNLPLKYINDLEENIRKTKHELTICVASKPLKKSFKKIPHIKLKEKILNYIDNSKYDCICKEEVALYFKVKEHEVENIFRELNIEGILSQRQSNYVHDTSRNPMFPMDVSGWASDTYTILNFNKK